MLESFMDGVQLEQRKEKTHELVKSCNQQEIKLKAPYSLK